MKLLYITFVAKHLIHNVWSKVRSYSSTEKQTVCNEKVASFQEFKCANTRRIVTILGENCSLGSPELSEFYVSGDSTIKKGSFSSALSRSSQQKVPYIIYEKFLWYVLSLKFGLTAGRGMGAL